MALRGSVHLGVHEGSHQAGDASPQQALRRQGSIRKVVHPGDSEGSGSGSGSGSADPTLLYGVPAKMLESSPRRPQENSPANYQQAYFASFIQEYSITSQLNMLGDQNIPGLYAIPSAKSPLVWFGVVFIRSGVYCGGVFRFNVFLPETFPESTRPRVVFESDIYHPLVDAETREVDLRVGFPDWKSRIHHLWQVLQYVRDMFYNLPSPPVRSPTQRENAAAVMLREDRLEFERRATDCARRSVGEAVRLQSAQFSDDPHYLRFDTDVDIPSFMSDSQLPSTQDWNDSRTKSVGLSWVRKGSLETFSKLVT